MGLVRFKKELKYSEFESLDPKDDETLYFISDEARIFLGNVEYGGPQVGTADSSTITLDSSAGLSGNFILSEDEGNALELTDDGLWAPQATNPNLEAAENNFVAVNQDGTLKDSEYSLADEVSDTPNRLPTAAAVYRSLEELMLLWDDTEADFPVQGWVDCTDQLVFPPDGIKERNRTYFKSNGDFNIIHIDLVYQPSQLDAGNLVEIPISSSVFASGYHFYVEKTNMDMPIQAYKNLNGTAQLELFGYLQTLQTYFKAEHNTEYVRIIADFYAPMDRNYPAVLPD
jgi:hypothetical protein